MHTMRMQCVTRAMRCTPKNFVNKTIALIFHPFYIRAGAINVAHIERGS